MNKIINKGCDFIRTFFNLKLKTKPMEQKRKYPIRQVSITNMTKFLNSLAGKTYRSKEIVEMQKEYHIRANFLIYAKQMNYCKKDESGAYYFLDRLFDPIHAKHLIEVSNKYNNEVMAKKKRRLEEKNNDLENKTEYTTITSSKIAESFDTHEMHFHHRNLLELQLTQLKSENNILEKEVNDLYSENEKFKIQVTQLKSENDILENEVSDLLDSNTNLKKSVDYLNEKIKGLNELVYNNNNNDSLQKENDLLNERLAIFQKLLVGYFK